MLPAGFDETALSSPLARAIARTCKTFGCRLVDRSIGAFNFYGELGSTWGDANSSYDGNVVVDLNAILLALRAVVSQDYWIDATGRVFTPTPWAAMNLISMRGPWTDFGGGAVQAGAFSTYTNFFEYPDTTSLGVAATNQTVYYARDEGSVEPWRNWGTSNQWYTTPLQNVAYTLSCIGSGTGIIATLKIVASDGTTVLYNSGNLSPGRSHICMCRNQPVQPDQSGLS
jgi:hypothetical protein